jgi:hypothetical protein
MHPPMAQMLLAGFRRFGRSQKEEMSRGSVERQAYNNAKHRCTNPADMNWKHYGGRGIKFLFTSFDQFLAEIGPKPEPKRNYVLDRAENNGHYEPGNVRWVTHAESTANRRDPSEWIPSIPSKPIGRPRKVSLDDDAGLLREALKVQVSLMNDKKCDGVVRQRAAERVIEMVLARKAAGENAA